MKNKTCGACRHFRDADFKDMCFWKDQHREACFDFELPTNGDRIRQGGDKALAEISIYADQLNDGVKVYRSTLIEDKYWLSRECAISYVECMLNAPAESDGER